MGKSRSAWDEGRRAWARLTGWHQDVPSGGHRDDGEEALKALTDIGRVRHLLDRAELVAVKTARAHSKSWAEIATMLGVTRQSAWEKWRDLDAAPVAAPKTERTAPSEIIDDTARETVERFRSGPDGEMVMVPDVIGLPWEDAREALTDATLVPVAPKAGRGSQPLPPDGDTGWVVVDQTPRGGAWRSLESSVTVWVERGSGPGVREPRRPTPTLRSARGERDEESQEAIG